MQALPHQEAPIHARPLRFAVAALAVGLAVAALPVLTTHARPCAAPAPPRAGAPVYLVLTSDHRVDELRCEAEGRVTLDRVRTPAEADTRFADEFVTGIVIDRGVYARLQPGHVRRWLTHGTGRVVLGLDLTAAQLRSDAEGSTPPLYGEGWGADLGASFVGYTAFRRLQPGTCGGGGTMPFRAPLLIERLVALAARCPV